MSTTTTAQVAVIVDIWLENRRGGSTLGIAERRPRISWPTAAEVSIESIDLDLLRGDGSVQQHTEAGAQSRLIAWPFPPLSSRETVILRVRPGGDSVPADA